MRQKAFPYTLDPAQIPSRKNLDITRPAYSGGPCVTYACPDECWQEHLRAWSQQLRDGNKAAPQPMPWGHCCFDSPTNYGEVPYGCTDPATIRAAWECHVRAILHGWDRDLSKAQLDALVSATVDAKMQGVDTGAMPFMACIMTSVGL